MIWQLWKSDSPLSLGFALIAFVFVDIYFVTFLNELCKICILVTCVVIEVSTCWPAKA